MTSRNLVRRLEDLEARLMPTSGPDELIEVQFVGPGREVVNTLVIKLRSVQPPKVGRWCFRPPSGFPNSGRVDIPLTQQTPTCRLAGWRIIPGP